MGIKNLSSNHFWFMIPFVMVQSDYALFFHLRSPLPSEIFSLTICAEQIQNFTLRIFLLAVLGFESWTQPPNPPLPDWGWSFFFFFFFEIEVLVPQSFYSLFTFLLCSKNFLNSIWLMSFIFNWLIVGTV